MKTAKNATKSIISVLLIAVMMLSLTACGVDMKKMSGTWVLNTIDGKSVADSMAEKGAPEFYGMRVVNITEEDFSISLIDPAGKLLTQKGTNTVKSNGINVKFNDGTYFEKDTTIGVEYDEKADTISFMISDGGKEQKLIFKKGSYDLQAKCDEYMAAAQAAAEEAYGEEEYSEGEYEEYDEGDWE